VAARAAQRDLIDPAIDAHHGRIVKRTGDGSLIEFRSLVDAVRCAIEVTLGAKPSNASILDGLRPLAPAAVCAAYAQTRRAETIKASRFGRRVYMRRSTARVVVRPNRHRQASVRRRSGMRSLHPGDRNALSCGDGSAQQSACGVDCAAAD
jgi:hypothetical protein